MRTRASIARPNDAADIRVHPAESRHRVRADDRRVEVRRRRPDVRGVSRRARRRRLSEDLDQSRRGPTSMIMTADQGAVVTLNGGETWSSWYNQPTAQFYHVSTDNAFPYRVCGGQQESGSACVASRGDHGQITFRDWTPGGRRGVRLRRARSAAIPTSSMAARSRDSIGAPARCSSVGAAARRELPDAAHAAPSVLSDRSEDAASLRRTRSGKPPTAAPHWTEISRRPHARDLGRAGDCRRVPDGADARVPRAAA